MGTEHLPPVTRPERRNRLAPTSLNPSFHTPIKFSSPPVCVYMCLRGRVFVGACVCGCVCVCVCVYVCACLPPHQRGPLWGAKITGGGSGGTVCILSDATPQAEAAVMAVVAEFEAITGHHPFVFRGSSPGAAHCPPVRVMVH